MMQFLMEYKWDGAALVTLGATFLGWLPEIAAGLAAVVYLVKLYDRFTKGSKL